MTKLKLFISGHQIEYNGFPFRLEEDDAERKLKVFFFTNVLINLTLSDDATLVSYPDTKGPFESHK